MNSMNTPTATQTGFDQALYQWRHILGAEHVHTTGDMVVEFADPYGVGEDERLPCAVLQPESAEEIQDILRVGQEHAVPIWVNSQGRNNGYGGGAPLTEETVVVNLRRMNRVLEINEELAYVVVEPGVSYFDLYEAVRESGKQLMIDVPDLGWGSVIGNALDHGNGYTPYGDHAAAVCGMEVVLPDGEIIRTGMGAMDTADTFHLNKRGFGPSVEGLFMQSNFGVVTKMGIWVMPKPETYMDAWITVPKDEDLEELVESFRPFLIDGTVGNCPTLFNPLGPLPIKASRSDIWDQEGMVPRVVADEIGKQAGLGAWSIRFALYGDEVIVARNLERIQEGLSHIEGVKIWGDFLDQDDIQPEENRYDQKQKVHAGVPDLQMLKLLEWDGTPGGHLTFASMVPLTGDDMRKIVELVRTTQEGAGIEYHAGIILYQRFAVHISLLVYALANLERASRVRELYAQMVVDAARMGYAEYRAHLDFMDLVADQFAHNNGALRRFVDKLKDAVDPNGILAPGKQGIWPAALRGENSSRAMTHHTSVE